MIQSRPHEFMVKYTPQKDWISGSGMLIAFAFFLGGISGGLYLAALYFDDMVGMSAGWLLAILMGGLDMAHLSKPFRFWRMILKPQTSWISRGFIFIILFVFFAALQLAFSFWLPELVWVIIFKVLAGIAAFAVVIYSGFVVSYVSAIKLWNSAIVPVLFVIAGLIGGLAVMLLISLFRNSPQLTPIQNALMVILVVYLVVIVTYLLSATYSGQAAKSSVMWIVRGSIAPVFWAGLCFLGIVIPVAILFYLRFFGLVSPVLSLVAAVGAIAGTLAFRYVILKAGVYSPLMATRSV